MTKGDWIYEEGSAALLEKRPHMVMPVGAPFAADQVVADEFTLSNAELADLHAEFNQNLFSDDNCIRDDVDWDNGMHIIQVYDLVI